MASGRVLRAALGTLASLVVVLGGPAGVTPTAVTAPTAPPPIWHPHDDGGHADHGPRGRDLGQAGDSLPHGVDVSGHQPDVDWSAAHDAGARFAYVKATEGTDYQSPEFSSEYSGASTAGILRGAYHFALPDRSDAVTQATYFLAHGGAPTGDGQNLPPMIDIEDDPYGDQCYGLSPDDMVAWLRSFSDTVAARTHRLPTIYTSLRWWSACTDDSSAFGANPLFIAHYDDAVGPLPAGWQHETFWQYSDSGPLPGDQDVFQGTSEQLQAFGENPAPPSTTIPSTPSTPATTPPSETTTTTPSPTATPTTTAAPAD